MLNLWEKLASKVSEAVSWLSSCFKSPIHKIFLLITFKITAKWHSN